MEKKKDTKRKKIRGVIPLPSPEEIEKVVNECVDRIATPKDAPYFRELLLGMVHNHMIPTELLKHIPLPAKEVGKTRFDQIFDASMALAFPEYRKDTLERLLGPVDGKGIKIWRVIIPEKYKIAHVLLRAKTYPEAFALACDYVCKVSLRLYKQIPTDLTIRVLFMGERALKRYLGMRWASKTHKRNQLKLVGRDFTFKQASGARLAALSHPLDPKYSIMKYAEMKDLQRIRESKSMIRTSIVESESHKKK